MPRSPQKRQLLRQEGALNPRADAITSGLFQQSEFFDPADSVQVKYEMLRQVELEGQPVSEAARAFGFSRPSFYQAQAAFEEAGLVGMLPHKRGPRGGNKLTAEVVLGTDRHAHSATVSLRYPISQSILTFLARRNGSESETLLSDIRNIFARSQQPDIPSRDLSAAFCEIKVAPWTG